LKELSKCHRRWDWLCIYIYRRDRVCSFSLFLLLLLLLLLLFLLLSYELRVALDSLYPPDIIYSSSAWVDQFLVVSS